MIVPAIGKHRLVVCKFVIVIYNYMDPWKMCESKEGDPEVGKRFVCEWGKSGHPCLRELTWIKIGLID